MVTAVAFNSPAEFYERVGTTLGVGEWHRVRQADIDAFGRATADMEDIHVDVEAARRAGFEGTIAHGLFTLSLCAHFMSEQFSVSNARGLFLGFDRVRFLQPVPIGSRIRASVAVVEGKATSWGDSFRLQLTFEVEGLDGPVCVAEPLLAYLRESGKSG